MNKFFTAGAILALLTGVASLQAQNGVGDFSVERILTLNNVLSPPNPSLPDAVLARLQNGTVELRQLFTYSSAQRTLEQLAFVVPANSPLPFPDPRGAPVGDHYIVQIESA